jgi:hypothetical protein
VIDVSPYIEQLERKKEKMANWINECAFSYTYHMRIIFDKEVPFPKNYEMVEHDRLIEVSHVPYDKIKTPGYSKPGKQFLGIELRYLWRQFHPNKTEQVTKKDEPK